MHAEKCPICEGKGAVIDDMNGYAPSTNRVVCHGCGGKGWVEVHDAVDGWTVLTPVDWGTSSAPFETHTNAPINSWFDPNEDSTVCVSDVLAPRVAALRALAEK